MRNSVYRLQRLSTQRMHFIVLFSMKVALGLSLLERQTTTSVSIQAASPNCHTVHKRSSSDDNHTLPECTSHGQLYRISRHDMPVAMEQYQSTATEQGRAQHDYMHIMGAIRQSSEK